MFPDDRTNVPNNNVLFSSLCRTQPLGQPTNSPKKKHACTKATEVVPYDARHTTGNRETLRSPGTNEGIQRHERIIFRAWEKYDILSCPLQPTIGNNGEFIYAIGESIYVHLRRMEESQSEDGIYRSWGGYYTFSSRAASAR